MTDEQDDRRAELLAAAVSGAASPEESIELDRLRAADPTIELELAELRATAQEVRALGTWQHTTPSDALRGRIVGIALHDAHGAPTEAAAATRPGGARRRGWRDGLVALGAAACIALGVGIGSILPTGPAERHGAPGELGALEHVEFVAETAGARIDGDLVAHTWGTETVLEIDGLPAGAVFTVVLIDTDGAEWPSGGFIGDDITIDCRVNAAVPREEVSVVEIRDADGVTIASASLPAVEV